MSTVVIDPRFNGPPGSANGGYTAGLLAQDCEDIVEVTLRWPPPLGRPLQLVRSTSEAGRTVADGNASDHAQCVQLFDGDTLVAEAHRLDALDLAVPTPPSLEAAIACIENFRGFRHHSFPHCFVCGPEREAGDGLRIFPGPSVSRSTYAPLVACPWAPDASMCDATGHLAAPFLWAALDCPGYFACADSDEVAVLGRMALQRLQMPRAGAPCIIVGWPLGREGRKLAAGTALFAADGELLARARQTWIVRGNYQAIA